MTKQVYALYDSKARSYHPPVMYNSEGEAERAFRTSSTNKQTMIGMYPEDHDLFHLGSFDTDTAKFNLLKTPEHKWKAQDMLKTSAQYQPGEVLPNLFPANN